MIDEDLLLLESHKEFPNQWSKIARLIDGRTENMVKNRFKAIEKQRKQAFEPICQDIAEEFSNMKPEKGLLLSNQYKWRDLYIEHLKQFDISKNVIEAHDSFRTNSIVSNSNITSNKDNQNSITLSNLNKDYTFEQDITVDQF